MNITVSFPSTISVPPGGYLTIKANLTSGGPLRIIKGKPKRQRGLYIYKAKDLKLLVRFSKVKQDGTRDMLVWKGMPEPYSTWGVNTRSPAFSFLAKIPFTESTIEEFLSPYPIDDILKACQITSVNVS